MLDRVAFVVLVASLGCTRAQTCGANSLRGVVGRDACLSGWKAWGGACYLLKTDPSDWFGARDACREVGGALAVPRSADENDFITGIIREEGKDLDSVWINCNDLDEEGEWKCQAESGFWRWGDTEPNGEQQGVEEDCLMMTANGFWGDVGCSRLLPAACVTVRPEIHLL